MLQPDVSLNTLPLMASTKKSFFSTSVKFSMKFIVEHNHMIYSAQITGTFTDITNLADWAPSISFVRTFFCGNLGRSFQSMIIDCLKDILV